MTAMTAAAIRLTLDSPAANYQPGARLSGRFQFKGSQPRSARAAELSVLWYTAGKGEEDMAIHHFERVVDEPGRPLDLRVPRRFSTVLPFSPLSYDGQLVKVCWCVRLRLFLSQGGETVAEVPFRMGSVSPTANGKPASVASDLRTDF
jgi:hypothetical protein